MSTHSTQITLTTDFGLSDSYVGQMKGVILNLFPAACIVDISHQVPPHDIFSAARLLKESVWCWASGTVHIAVVDPGVGSSRRRIVIETASAFFVGPDNGIFSLVAPVNRRLRAVEITKTAFLPDAPALSTFDARDIFAPAGALIAQGADPLEFGESVDPSSLVELSLPQPVTGEDQSVMGEIVYFDHFGNAVTNIPHAALPSLPKKRFFLDSVELDGLALNYSAIPHGKCAIVINSQSMLEIAAYCASAKDLMHLRVGDQLLVRALTA